MSKEALVELSHRAVEYLPMITLFAALVTAILLAVYVLAKFLPKDSVFIVGDPSSSSEEEEEEEEEETSEKKPRRHIIKRTGVPKRGGGGDRKKMTLSSGSILGTRNKIKQ